MLLFLAAFPVTFAQLKVKPDGRLVKQLPLFVGFPGIYLAFTGKNDYCYA